MKSLSTSRSFAAAALALGALVAASAAHARSDVHFSIGFQTPGVYVQPQPVYVQPQPVYGAPRHVYVEPQPVYAPGPGHHGRYLDGRRLAGQHGDRRGPYGDRDGDGIANVYDQDSHRNQWRHAQPHGPFGDLDRDGIANQDDRDRDGDGVRNRWDRFPDDPYRY